MSRELDPAALCFRGDDDSNECEFEDGGGPYDNDVSVDDSAETLVVAGDAGTVLDSSTTGGGSALAHALALALALAPELEPLSSWLFSPAGVTP